jgi:hypothetical protein
LLDPEQPIVIDCDAPEDDPVPVRTFFIEDGMAGPPVGLIGELVLVWLYAYECGAWTYDRRVGRWSWNGDRLEPSVRRLGFA